MQTLLLLASLLAPQTPDGAPAGLPVRPPSAVVDLTTSAGVDLLSGAWRYADARPVPVEFRAPGPDGKPTGAPLATWDVAPRAGGADFDDSAWELVEPETLARRRGTGRLCFGWYRLELTVPERVGELDPRGATAVLRVVVDDYAEVWVDGELPRELGQSGGSLVAGWNAPNRLVVGRDLRPGQRIQLAVFAVNGPMSDAPANYLWVREAALELYGEPRAIAPTPVPTEVLRLDPALDVVLPRGARIEKLAEGFTFTEGPVWLPRGELLFSDPNENRIYRWTPDCGGGGSLSVFREASGYAGADVARFRQAGSNGLALHPDGGLAICEHGNRRVTRLAPDGRVAVLADRYRGGRLNSPNDLVFRSDGTLYFTDPPFGLPGFHGDPERELDVTGVYRLRDGELSLESDALTGPNGIALSPDERFLYVADWDDAHRAVTRYPLDAEGRLGPGSTFFDVGAAPEPEALDGLEVDELGNVYLSGPGGVWIVSPEGRHLGTLRGPELPANFAWGGTDGRTLFLTARGGLYRVRLGVRGAAWARAEDGVAAVGASTGKGERP